MGKFRSSSHTHNERWNGEHRFEHWYRDNSVYFITARCRDRFQALESEPAKAVFWDRYEHYTTLYGFVPWVTTLIGNHYHFLGCQKNARQLGQMMQCRRHGICADCRLYPHTRVKIEVDRGIRRALELNAFMTGVRYPRYDG